MRLLARIAASSLLILVCMARAESADYQVVHGWPSMPEGHMLGQATGVGVDSHNHVFVFHRADREWSYPFPEEPIQLPTIAVFVYVVDAWGNRVQKFISM